MKHCQPIIVFLFFISSINMGQPTLLKAKLKTKTQCMTKRELVQLVDLLSDSNELLQREVKTLRSEIGYPEQERLAIKDELCIIKNKIFGASSERRSRRQFREPKEKKEKDGPKVLLPSQRYPHLGVVQSEIDFQDTPLCKLCESSMEDMKITENAEYITVTQKTYLVVKQARKKYRCLTCHGDVKTAPSPPRLKPGSSFADEIAIDVAISKYCDHLPVERYVRQAERLGLVGIQSQSLIEQTHYLAKALRPVYDALKRDIQSSAVLHADETPWKLLEGDERKNWFLWGFFNTKNSYYETHNTRAAEVASTFLGNCQAEYLCSDAYSGYGRCTKGTKVKNAYCMAHARRKWVEAESNYPEATPMIDLIGELYGIEHEIKSSTPQVKLQERQTRSKLILTRMENYLFGLQVLPKSSVGKARNYMLKFWEGLTLFATDGRLNIDNNLAERGLRGPVVGRKNFLGNHSIRGANTTAILYSIIESCKLNNVEPYRYLRETVKAILAGQSFLTPSGYAEKYPENG